MAYEPKENIGPASDPRNKFDTLNTFFDPGNFFGGGGGGPGPSGMRDETLYATEDWQQIFGRAPTPAELAQVLPSYIDVNNPHIPNKAGGKAFVASLFQAQENTPEKLYARQQAEYLVNAPKFYGQIGGMFQSLLGRTATQDELSHFGKLLASGTVDSYQLQDFLKQQPEYTQKADETFRNQLSGQLQGYDKQYFEEQVMPSIQSNFAKQGRSVDSSGFAQALGQAGNQQNQQRQQYLAQLSAAQYGNTQSNAYDAYRQFAQNNMALQQQGSYAGVARQNELTDYQMQSQAYENYLKRFGKRTSPGAAALQGGLSGAAAGAMTGNPYAALFGGLAGAGLGYYSASQGGY